MAAVPNREEDRQTTLEADGRHDTQPSDGGEEPQGHKRTGKMKAVLEGRPEDLSHTEHDLQTQVHEIRHRETDVYAEGDFLDGQTDKPDYDSISHQPTKGHDHRDGREEHVASSLHSQRRAYGIIAGIVVDLAVQVHAGEDRAQEGPAALL